MGCANNIYFIIMRTTAFILQLLCLVLGGAGITIELLRGAFLGFIFITAASIIFAVSTKLYKLALLKENKHLKERTKNDEQNKN